MFENDGRRRPLAFWFRPDGDNGGQGRGRVKRNRAVAVAAVRLFTEGRNATPQLAIPSDALQLSAIPRLQLAGSENVVNAHEPETPKPPRHLPPNTGLPRSS